MTITRRNLLKPTFRRILLGALVLSTTLLHACGGPTEPPPVELHTLQAIVFYDENGDGALDPEERVRIPLVVLSCAGQTGTSETGTGRVTIANVPAGDQSLLGITSSFPSFFEAPQGGIRVTVPSAGDVLFPMTLPIANAYHHRYMAIGDSITEGYGSDDGRGYIGPLEESLEDYWGVDAIVVNRGIAGQKSFRGVDRIANELSRVDPAYTLILFGTNDWNDLECRHSFPCYTIDNLRTMIRTVRDYGSLPVVGTIPPVPSDWSPPERNEWVVSMNELIRPMAATEGAAVADIQAAFQDQPDLHDLFVDHIHPNDDGYKVIAGAFFRAIVMPRSQLSGASSSMMGLTWSRWSSRPQPLSVFSHPVGRE